MPFNAQNLRRIKQRKGLCFIQVISNHEDDEDDKDDDMILSYCRLLHRPVSLA